MLKTFGVFVFVLLVIDCLAVETNLGNVNATGFQLNNESVVFEEDEHLSQLSTFLSSFAASVERKLQNQRNITQDLDLKIRGIQDQLDEMKNTARKPLCPVYVDVALNNSTPSKNELINGGSEFSGKALYICRVLYQGNSVPGKYHGVGDGCSYSWGDRGHWTAKFEVLLKNNATLQWVLSQSVPVNSVEGGKTTGNEPLHVIRCQYKQGNQTAWHPGWYQPSVGTYTEYGRTKIRCEENQWEFLICV